MYNSLSCFFPIAYILVKSIHIAIRPPALWWGQSMPLGTTLPVTLSPSALMGIWFWFSVLSSVQGGHLTHESWCTCEVSVTGECTSLHPATARGLPHTPQPCCPGGQSWCSGRKFSQEIGQFFFLIIYTFLLSASEYVCIVPLILDF